MILADVAITGFPLPEIQVTLPSTLPIGDGIDSTYRLHPDSQSNISVRLDNYSTILLEYTVSKSVLYTATVTGKLVSPLGTPSDGDHLAGNYTFSILNRVLGNGPSQVVITLETGEKTETSTYSMRFFHTIRSSWENEFLKLFGK